MPFKEDRPLFIPSHPITQPRRVAGIALAGRLPALEAAFSGGALSQMAMCFNEFNNFCLEGVRAATAAIATDDPKADGQAVQSMLLTMDWHGSCEFMLCWTAPPAAAAHFCRAFVAHRPEFSRLHRWPHGGILGIASGELIFVRSGPDGQRLLRAFGEPIVLARKFVAQGESLATGSASKADLIVCGSELRAYFTNDESGREALDMRITCASA